MSEPKTAEEREERVQALIAELRDTECEAANLPPDEVRRRLVLERRADVLFDAIMNLTPPKECLTFNAEGANLR